jgi:hypothetical protein
MSKKTTTQEQKEIIALTPQQLSPADLSQLQELYRIAEAYALVADQIKGNTALIPDGQKVSTQFEAIARLMDNTKNQWVGQKLADMGYPKGAKVTVNAQTGEIKPIQDES